MEDLEFMDEALRLAREAAAEGEVPVGCVIVRRGEIVGRAGTAGRPEKPPWVMRKSRPSAKPAGIWGAGGSGSAPCM